MKPIEPSQLSVILHYSPNRKNTYIIQAVTGGPVKVGCSENPWTRVAALNTGNPEPLRLVAILPWSERHIHEHLDERGRRYRGEWFDGDGLYIEALIEQATENRRPPLLRGVLAQHPDPHTQIEELRECAVWHASHSNVLREHLEGVLEVLLSCAAHGMSAADAVRLLGTAEIMAADTFRRSGARTRRPLAVIQ